mgnify:CR=1 FL=1
MALYSITYDLVKNRDYERLYKAIRSLSNNTYAKPTESQWIVQSDKTAMQIVEFLRNHVDHDDVIFVIQVDRNSWAALHMNKSVVNWLNN